MKVNIIFNFFKNFFKLVTLFYINNYNLIIILFLKKINGIIILCVKNFFVNLNVGFVYHPTLAIIHFLFN